MIVLCSVHQLNSLRNIVKWANVMCTVYDVATEIRNVILGGGSVIDVMGAMLKGVAVGFMCDGMCKTSLGIVLKPMMAIFGLGSQVDQRNSGINGRRTAADRGDTGGGLCLVRKYRDGREGVKESPFRVCDGDEGSGPCNNRERYRCQHNQKTLKKCLIP